MERAYQLATAVVDAEVRYAHKRIVITGPKTVETVVAAMAVRKGVDLETLRVVTVLKRKDVIDVGVIMRKPKWREWASAIKSSAPAFAVEVATTRTDLVEAVRKTKDRKFSWIVISEDACDVVPGGGIVQSDLVVSIILGADLIMVPYTWPFVRLADAMQTEGQRVWLLDTEGTVYRHNFVTDTMRLGRALRDRALGSADYVELFGTTARLLETRVIKAGVLPVHAEDRYPTVHWIDIDEDLLAETRLIASSVFDELRTYYGVSVNAGSLTAANVMLARRSASRRLSLSEAHAEKADWLGEICRLLEAAFIQPIPALGRITGIAAQTRMARRTMQFQAETKKFLAVKEVLMRTLYGMPPPSGEFTQVVIVPDLPDFEDFKLQMGYSLGVGTGVPEEAIGADAVTQSAAFGVDQGRTWARLNVWFLGGDARVSLASVVAPEEEDGQEPARTMVLVFDESAVRGTVSAGSVLLKAMRNVRIDDFTFRGAYDPEWTTFLMSVFGRNMANVHVHLGHTAVEESLLAFFRRRKEMVRASFREPSLIEASPPPLIRMDEIPMFESPLTKKSYYDTSNLTPIEMLKMIEVFRRASTVRGDYVAEDVSPSGSRPIEINRNYGADDERLRQIPWLEEFVVAGVRITAEDVIGLLKMVPPLRALVAVSKVRYRPILETVLGILLGFFARTTVELSPMGLYVPRELVDAVRVTCREMANKDGLTGSIPRLCEGLASRLETSYKLPETEESGVQEVSRRARREWKADIKAAIQTHITNPRLLILLAMTTAGSRYGREWVWPRLVQWWKLHAWGGRTRSGMHGMVWDTIEYMVDKQTSAENAARMVEEVTTVAQEAEWF